MLQDSPRLLKLNSGIDARGKSAQCKEVRRKQQWQRDSTPFKQGDLQPQANAEKTFS